MDSLIQDLRQAWRSLARSRALALTAVLVMAIGTGAATAVVSLLDELRLRPLALPRPSELHLAGMRYPQGLNTGFSWPEFQDLHRAMPVGQGLAAFSTVNTVVRSEDRTEHVWGEQVSGDYFAVTGARVALGRALDAADDRPEASRVLVLSHGAWVRAYGSDPGVIGRTVRLNRVPYEVVGVAERSFRGLLRGFQPEFWLPISSATQVTGDADALETRRSRWIQLFARVPDGARPEATAARLQAEIQAMAADGREQVQREGTMLLWPAGSGDTGLLDGAARFAFVLSALVAVLLALAVANLAGLMLARSSARRREMGVRLAIGAPRARLVRQLVLEGLLLTGAGGAAGLLLASPLVHLLVGFLPASGMPLAIEPRLDLRVLATLGSVLLVTGLGLALAPAWEAGRLDLQSAIRDESGTGWWPGQRLSLRGALVIAQVALSFLLLVGAALFGRSLLRETSISPGFDPNGRWALTLDLGGLENPSESRPAFMSALLERVRALPGVERVSFAQYQQPGPGGNRMGYAAGDLGLDGIGEIDFDVLTVGSEYFRTLGIPLTAGREFTPTEANRWRTAPVVVLNRALAKRLFGDVDPMGRTLHVYGRTVPAFTVVGLVPDYPLRSLRDTGAPCAFIPGPLSQTPMPVLMVHARDGRPPLAAISRIARELSPEVATGDPRALAQVVGGALATARLTTWLLGAFAVVAVSLASLGLYGLLAHAVARRRREIGVRMALGADARRIVRLVAGGGARLVAAGVALGMLGCALLARPVDSLLYGVHGLDVTSWAAAAAALLGVAVLAGLLPARVAARVSPSEALREE